MIFATSTCLLNACGDSGSNGGATLPATASVSSGGIWHGTDSVTGLTVLGVVDEQGELRFARADGVQFVGSVSTATTAEIDASFDGYLPVTPLVGHHRLSAKGL